MTAHLILVTSLLAPRAFPTQQVDLVEAGVLAPSKAVFDSKRNCYYLIGGVWDGQIVRLDPESGALEELLRVPKGLTDIVYDRTVDRIFATTSYIDLFVIDPNRKYKVVQRWKAGGRPHALAFDPATKRLYVGNSNYSGRDAPGRSVQVFALGRAKVIETIKTPMPAELLALDRKGQRLYVTAPRSRARTAGPDQTLVAIATDALKIVETTDVSIASNIMLFDAANDQLILSKGTSRTLQSIRRADLTGAPKSGLALEGQELTAAPDGYFISDGYFDAHDKTIRLLFCVDRHRVNLDPEHTELLPYIVARLRFEDGRYVVADTVELPNASLWRGTLAAGPGADRFIAVARASHLALLGRFGAGEVTRRHVGFEVDRLAVNSETHRAYAADHETGRIAIVDTQSGRVVARRQRPPNIEWLAVDEARDRVFVLCNRSMQTGRGWDNRWLLNVTDGAIEKTLHVLPLRLGWIGLARLRDYHLGPRGELLRLVFTTGIIEVNLNSGKVRSASRPVRDDIVGYRIDLGHERMLVGGSRRQLALIDTRTLEVLEATELDHKKECAPAAAENRRMGPFDVCAAAVQMWRPDDIRVRFYDMVPFRVSYRLQLPTDRGPTQPGSTVRLAGRTGDGETIALHQLDPSTMKDKHQQFVTLMGRGKAGPDFYDDQTLFAIDARNSVVLQLHRGAFKERIRPKDFRKELNHLYSFRLNDDQSVLRLHPRGAFRDNPRDIALDTRARVAVISHGHASTLTLVRY